MFYFTSLVMVFVALISRNDVLLIASGLFAIAGAIEFSKFRGK